MSSGTSTGSRAVNSNFIRFLSDFPSVESRHALAVDCVPLNGEIATKLSIESQAVIGSHWGSDETQLSQVADVLYNTKAKLLYNIGCSVMVFEAGNRGDINAAKDFELPRDVSLRVGTLRADALHHWFSGTFPAGSFRSRDRAVQLSVQVGLPVSNLQGLRVSRFGEVSPVEPPEEDKDLIIYAATIPLKGDLTDYRRGLEMSRREVLFGNYLAFEAVRRLTEVVSGAAETNFGRLRRAGLVAPGKPLPRLDSIFSSTLVPESVGA